MEEQSLYRVYSQWLRERYGSKVYKLPVNVPVSCPNRDGTAGKGGCIYCGAKGGGNETLSDTLSVAEQVEKTGPTSQSAIRPNYLFPTFKALPIPTAAHSSLSAGCVRQWVMERVLLVWPSPQDPTV